MMRDAFGDALQKISSAARKPSSPVVLASPAGPALAVGSASVQRTVEAPAVPELVSVEPPSITIIKFPRAVESKLPGTVMSGETVTPAEAARPVSSEESVEQPVDSKTAVSESLSNTRPSASLPEAETRSPMTFLLDHRRQTAAVVVLICIAAIWSDEGSQKPLFTSSNEPSTSSSASAETDADTMLSDFDAIEVQPLREPADPVEPSAADPFPFSIPTDESAASVTSDAAASNVSQATSSLPPTTTPTTGKQTHSEQSPFSPVSASGSKSVRFTGQIEPLK